MWHLAAYSNLWHERFLGWPSVSPVPVHKDHITDWITTQTSKGLKFESVNFKPAAIQVTGDVAVTCYWQTFRWVDKNGDGATLNSSNWKVYGGLGAEYFLWPRFSVRGLARIDYLFQQPIEPRAILGMDPVEPFGAVRRLVSS